VLVLAGKLHHAAFVIRPGRYFVRRLLQLTGLHLNGAERAGGGDTWGRQRKKAHSRKVLRLSKEFMADVGWWRWYLGEGREGSGSKPETTRVCSPLGTDRGSNKAGSQRRSGGSDQERS